MNSQNLPNNSKIGGQSIQIQSQNHYLPTSQGQNVQKVYQQHSENGVHSNPIELKLQDQPKR